jgi:translation initiation factor 3 subunit L
MQANYHEALKCVQCIDYTHLPIYSKAYACYLSLFYYAGFAFLMIGRHKETVKIFETLLSFIGKYKQFYSKYF